MGNLSVWERIKSRMTGASTVRGFILLFGLIGWKVSPDEYAAYVAVADALVYIAYEIFRKDSAAKAVNEVLSKIANAKIVLLCLIMLGFLLGPIPPAQADNVAQFQEIALTWDANTEPDIAKYRIYKSDVSGTYDAGTDAKAFKVVVHPNTETERFTLPVGTHYFVCTAVDQGGYESAFSNEVFAVVSDDAPAAPGGCAILKF